MEYVYYLAITLVILVVCYCLVRVRPEEYLAESAQAKDEEEETSASFHRPDVSGIPVPWGWPGSEIEHHRMAQKYDSAGSDFLHRWVDHLVAKKTTVDDNKYQHRRESCMRALLEDRFVSPSHMAEIEYRKVKPPLLRDPSLPHDQMDNFPSGKLNGIESRLNGQPPVKTVERHGAGKVRHEKLREVRTPWGW